MTSTELAQVLEYTLYDEAGEPSSITDFDDVLDLVDGYVTRGELAGIPVGIGRNSKAIDIQHHGTDLLVFSPGKGLFHQAITADDRPDFNQFLAGGTADRYVDEEHLFVLYRFDDEVGHESLRLVV